MILAIACGSLAALFCWIAWYGCHMTVRIKLRGIPGPPLAFLSGNLLKDGRTGQLHLGFAEWPKKYGKVLRFLVGHKPYILVTDPELVQEIGVKQFRTFQNRPFFPFVLNLNEEDEERASWMALWARDKKWTLIRSAMAPIFQGNALSSYVPIFHTAATQMIDSLQAESKTGSVHVEKHLQSFSLKVVGESAFGVNFGGKHGQAAPVAQAAFTVMSQKPERNPALLAALIFPPLKALLVRMVKRGFVTEDFKRTIHGWRFLTGVAKTLVSNTRRVHAGQSVSLEPVVHPPSDSKDLSLVAKLQQQGEADGAAAYAGMLPKSGSVLSRLIESRQGDAGERLTDNQIIPQSMNLLFGGGDTTGLSLMYTLYELACEDEAQRALVAEVDDFRRRCTTPPALDDLSRFPYTEAVIQEALRLHAPGNPMYIKVREAAHDTTLAGFRIPKGTAVVMNHIGMACDPELFPSPEAFRPERWLQDGADGTRARSLSASIPFGLGPRRCPAHRFAIAEMTVALYHIFSSFSVSLDPGSCSKTLEKTSGINIHPVDPIMLRLHARSA